MQPELKPFRGNFQSVLQDVCPQANSAFRVEMRVAPSNALQAQNDCLSWMVYSGLRNILKNKLYAFQLAVLQAQLWLPTISISSLSCIRNKKLSQSEASWDLDIWLTIFLTLLKTAINCLLQVVDQRDVLATALCDPDDFSHCHPLTAPVKTCWRFYL